MAIEEYKNKISKAITFSAAKILGVFPEAYIVGGFVRDAILEREPKDIDLATPLLPEEVACRAKEVGISVYETGLKHGTLTLVLDDCKVEITTFRKDTECDGRHAKVEFSEDINEDLKRRDFTVNAIAYNLEKDDLIWAEGALDDIDDGIIMCVGDPESRFHEDYLRMLRAVRLAEQLEFEIDNPVSMTIRKMSPLIQRISKERIKEELFAGLGKSESVYSFLSKLLDLNLMQYIVPEVSAAQDFLQNKWHTETLEEHLIVTADSIKKKDPLLRFTALVHDVGKLKVKEKNDDGDLSFVGHEKESELMAKKICKDLKMSTEETKYVTTLCRRHMSSISKMKEPGIKKLVSHLGEDMIDPFLRLRIADKRGNLKNNEEEYTRNRASIRRFLRLWRKIKYDKDPMKVIDLAIGGKEVMEELGIEQGPQVGKVLNELFELTIEKPELNEREELLSIIRNRKKQLNSYHKEA